jgi:hypothetical protein
MVVMLSLITDPVAFWVPVLDAWYGQLEIDGVAIPAVDMERQAALMSGALCSLMLAGSLVTVLLELRLAAGAGGGTADGFRSLRLGYALGGLAAVAGLAGLAGAPLQGALLVFGIAFALQGIAVAAWWADRLGWPRSWWWPLVILPLLLLQVAVLEMTLLATVGFIDNWFNLRRRSAG